MVDQYCFYRIIFQAHERDADGEWSSSKGGVCTSRGAHERRKFSQRDGRSKMNQVALWCERMVVVQ